MKNIIQNIGIAALCLSLLTSCQTSLQETSSVQESSEEITVSESVNSDPITDTSSEETQSTYSEANMIHYERKEVPSGYRHRTVKILTFGDSFTVGAGTMGGYRYYLFEKLYKAGADFEFVGPYRQRFYNLPDEYSSHLSTGGKKTDEAIAMYKSYVENNGNDYDIILSMFGCNDCYTGRSSEETLRYYRTLLDTIFADKENAIVYVASLPEVEAQFPPFNQALPEFCAQYAQETGKEVYFVEMNGIHKLIRENDCISASDAHPGNSGNEKMAASWYDAIVNRVLELNDDFVKGTKETVAVESVSIEPAEVTVAVNEQKSLNFTVLPENATIKTVNWESSNPEIAVVDDYGIVTPKAVGETTITLTSLEGGKTAECKVTVTEKKELPTEAFKKLVFDSDFGTTANWTGDTDMIKTASLQAITAWIGDQKTITSAKDVNMGDRFCVSMRYCVSGGEEATNDEAYAALVFGDFRLVISRCGGKIELFKGETSLGSYKFHSLPNRFYDYSVAYDAGKITVLRNEETLFTAETESQTVKSAVTYVWNVVWNKSMCNFIKVYTAA